MRKHSLLKVACLCLITCMVLALAACGEDVSIPTQTTTTTRSEETTPPPETTVPQPDIDAEYCISTVDDLQKLVNASETYTLINDIDMMGAEFDPIVGFSGVLEGNGHTIKNFSITGKENNIGFFTTLKGTVKNLRLENVTVTAEGKQENVGILCGQLTGTASDIYVSGSVNAQRCSNVGGVIGTWVLSGTQELETLENAASVIGADHVGGIVGCVDTESSATLTTVANSGKIEASGNYAGGLCGYLYVKGYYSSKILTATDCSNTGAVNGKEYVGGLFGYAYTNGTDSKIADGASAAQITGEAYVGGLAGYCGNISMIDCSNTGSTLSATGFIKNDGVKYAYVGGYAGYGYNFSGCTNEIEIIYAAEGRYVGGIAGYLCGSSDNTMDELNNNANISGADYVGGIFGYADVCNLDNASNSGDISGTTYVGGIVGCVNTESNATLTAATNSGKIEASGNYAGGLCGYLYVKGYYSSIILTATDCSNTGAVTGKEYVGGLFGYAYTNGTDSKIADSASAAQITGEAYVGGLAGQLANTSMSNCSNTGSFLTVTGNGQYIGGIVGHLNCSSGNIMDELKNNANISGTDYVGGIFGYADVCRLSNVSNTGDISGTTYVGGIVGCVNTESNATLTAVTNSGKIEASGNYAGGICGYLYVKGYYSSKILTATDCSNTGAVTGKEYVGGLFGYAYTNGTSSKITNSTSSATINGDDKIGEIAGELKNITIE